MPSPACASCRLGQVGALRGPTLGWRLLSAGPSGARGAGRVGSGRTMDAVVTGGRRFREDAGGSHTRPGHVRCRERVQALTRLSSQFKSLVPKRCTANSFGLWGAGVTGGAQGPTRGPDSPAPGRPPARAPVHGGVAARGLGGGRMGLRSAHTPTVGTGKRRLLCAVLGPHVAVLCETRPSPQGRRGQGPCDWNH